MTNDGKPIYCWDASVFLAWITIIATAIIYQCDVLHSLDDRGSGPLRLNGSSIVDQLRIEKPIPFSRQKGLC